MSNVVYRRIGEIIRLGAAGSDKTDQEILASLHLIKDLIPSGPLTRWLRLERICTSHEWDKFIKAYSQRLERRIHESTDQATLRMPP